jgi:hypothetical protein
MMEFFAFVRHKKTKRGKKQKLGTALVIVFERKPAVAVVIVFTR